MRSNTTPLAKHPPYTVMQSISGAVQPLSSLFLQSTSIRYSLFYLLINDTCISLFSPPEVFLSLTLAIPYFSSSRKQLDNSTSVFSPHLALLFSLLPPIFSFLFSGLFIIVVIICYMRLFTPQKHTFKQVFHNNNAKAFKKPIPALFYISGT